MQESVLKRVAGLLRVSTEKIEQAESPEAQLLFIREEIRRHSHGYEVWIDSGLVYEDELTGAVVMDRPGVQRLVHDARARKFDLLVMKSIQRLGRDTLGLLHLKRQLDDLGIELVALQDGYRSGRDPELIFLVHADRAQAGREDISRNVRNAMRQRARQGRWMAGRVPFGYRRKNRHELEPHPDTAPIVQEIFRLRRSGWGETRIVGHLNQLGVPAPGWWEACDRLPHLEELAVTDERYAQRLERNRRLVNRRPPWAPRTLRVVLKNTAYYGELQYNRKFWRVRLGGRKVLETRAPEEWIAIPCPPIVSREEWEEVQQVRRRKSTRDRVDAHVYLLSGLLQCGKCGNRMNGGGGKVGKYGWYGYYHCMARRDLRTCDLPSPRCEALEDAVLKVLPDPLSQLPTQQVGQERNAESARVLVQHLEALLADLADERRYYRNEHRRNRLTDAELDTELARITEAEGRVKAELEQVRRTAFLPDLLQQEAEHRRRLAEQVALWQANRVEIDRHQLRALVHAAVNRVVYRGLADFDVHLRFSQTSWSWGSSQ